MKDQIKEFLWSKNKLEILLLIAVVISPLLVLIFTNNIVHEIETKSFFPLLKKFVFEVKGQGGINYYVSNFGDDNNSGTSPLKPWRTVAKVNEFYFSPGDTINFERGGVWRDSLYPQSGNESGPITYRAYGEGEKPLILGSQSKSKPEDWENAGGNIWKTKSAKPIGKNLISNSEFTENENNWKVWSDNGAVVVKAGRDTQTFDTSPASFKLSVGNNSGIKGSNLQLSTPIEKIERGKYYLLSFKAKATAEFTISYIRLIRGRSPYEEYYWEKVYDDNWECQQKLFSKQIGTEWKEYNIYYHAKKSAQDAILVFYLGSTMPRNSSFFIDTVSFKELDSAPFLVDVGNLIFNEGEKNGTKVWQEWNLSKQDQFWYDKKNMVVKMYSQENPASRYKSIECALFRHIINEDHARYVTYENLHLAYGAYAGIGGGYTDNIKVKSCDINFIGGGVFNCSDNFVRCGNAIEFWVKANNNKVEDCNIWEIYDAALTNQGEGADNVQYNISYKNNRIWDAEYCFEYFNDQNSPDIHDIYFENNVCLNSGEGWGGDQRPDGPNGRHLVLFDLSAATRNMVIKNNVFANAKRVSMGLSWPATNLGNLIMDNNEYYPETNTDLISWYAYKNYTTQEFASYKNEMARDSHSTLSEIKYPGLEISGTNPESGAVETQRNKVINVSFKENIEKGGNADKILLTRDGMPVYFTASVDNKDLIINPSILEYGTYRLFIPAGAVFNALGNKILAHPYEYSFQMKTSSPGNHLEVNAGPDQHIILPHEAELFGQAPKNSFPDPARDLAAKWTKLSGPGDVIFSDDSSLNTKASFSQTGDYVLELSAEDRGLRASDRINIKVDAIFPEGLIVDHNAVQSFEKIPFKWIEAAKNLTMQYAHASYGARLISGFSALEKENSILKAIVRQDNVENLPSDLKGLALKIYDGNPPETSVEPGDYWNDESALARTRAVAKTGKYDYSFWAWEGEQSSNSEAIVNRYLHNLDRLEKEFPQMRFIYATGHTDGTDTPGTPNTLKYNNRLIRNYAQENQKILFDLADIESYDPLGNYYPKTSGDCPWCAAWCGKHSADCIGLENSNSQIPPYLSKLEAKAFWWMMARLAGWDGKEEFNGGMMGDWRLDGDLKDGSGNNHDLTIRGNLQWETGRSKSSLSLDGKSYAIISDNEDFDNTSKLTISFWFYPTLLDNNSRGIISKRMGQDDNDAYSIYLGKDSHLYIDINSADNRFVSNKVFQSNIWHHVAVVYDGTLSPEQRARLYIDGNLDKAAYEANTSIPNYYSSLYLGALDATSQFLYQGRLDDVKIMKTSLDERAVMKLAEGNHYPQAENLEVNIAMNKSKEILLKATDQDNDNLSYRLLEGSGPKYGIIKINGQLAKYIPENNFQGEDSFRYAANDGNGESIAEVKISIEKSNQPPKANAGEDQIINLSSMAYIQGSVSDDGWPDYPGHLDIVWHKEKGPCPAGIEADNSKKDKGKKNAYVKFNCAGEYILKLEATDGEFSASDEIKITVQSGTPVLAKAPEKNVCPGCAQKNLPAAKKVGEKKEVIDFIIKKEGEEVFNNNKTVPLTSVEKIFYMELASRGKITDKNKYSIAYFIHYGTTSTERLGAGERAGVISSYIASFGKAPEKLDDWQDVVKISDGHWPAARNERKETITKETIFRRVYKRIPRMDNANDSAAVIIITYGLRPLARNEESEKAAIKIFKGIYGHNPANADEWNIMRAIAYSGAKR